METTQDSSVSASSVNYDDSPIVQLEVEGVDYRVDTGLGSAVAVSRRAEGTWQWSPVTEGKWDGRRLKARELDHAVITALSQALASAMKALEEG
jgi:hypothetical protein